jgi:hypothetical protein
MIEALKRLFGRTPISATLRDEIYDAERKELEHRLAAGHHKALADMYEERLHMLKSRLG